MEDTRKLQPAHPRRSRYLALCVTTLATLSTLSAAGCDADDADSEDALRRELMGEDPLFGEEGLSPLDGGISEEGEEGEEGGEPIEAAVHELPCGDASWATPPAGELCPPHRQIIQLAGGGCPVPDVSSGWAVDDLFKGTGVAGSVPTTCRYRWIHPTDPTPNLSSLPGPVSGQTSADCRVIPQGPLDAGLGPSFEAALSEGIDPVLDPQASLGRSGVPVHLMVVDTAPAKTRKGVSTHGPAMAAIVSMAASGCAPGIDESAVCQREVETVLGLPQLVGSADPAYATGGFYGYQSDLAQGIAGAIESWDNPDEPLIVNLSVGWEPSLGDLDSNGESTSHAVNAVRDLVGLVGCRGGVVVASSGNQPVGSCVGEATGPGSWEAIAGFDYGRCLNLGMDPAQIELDSHPAGFHPLLYAATPLDWDFHNLADFRPGSNARIASMGYGAAASVNGARLGPVTGSSVAAASLSGIAGLVWSYYPSLTADELMGILYDSGGARADQGSAVMADLHGGGSVYEQRVVTACGALAYACDLYEGNASQCGALAAQCATPTVDADAWWASLNATVSAVPPEDAVYALAPPLTEVECVSCGVDRTTKLPFYEPLSAGQMPNPWVLPQPANPPCPMCGIQDDDGYLVLAPEYGAMGLTNVSVLLYDVNGVVEQLHYGALPVTSTSLYTLNDSEFLLVDRSMLAPVDAFILMTFSDIGDPLDPQDDRRFTARNQIPIRITP